MKRASTKRLKRALRKRKPRCSTPTPQSTIQLSPATRHNCSLPWMTGELAGRNRRALRALGGTRSQSWAEPYFAAASIVLRHAVAFAPAGRFHLQQQSIRLIRCTDAAMYGNWRIARVVRVLGGIVVADLPMDDRASAAASPERDTDRPPPSPHPTWESRAAIPACPIGCRRIRVESCAPESALADRWPSPWQPGAMCNCLRASWRSTRRYLDRTAVRQPQNGCAPAPDAAPCCLSLSTDRSGIAASVSCR